MSDNLSFDFKPVLDTAELNVVEIGELHLPSGKIIAGDPFFIFDQKPFKQSVKPGSYPVTLFIHKVEEDHYRIAFSKVTFSDKPATRWTLALTEGISDEDIKNLKKDEFFGYGVDAGLSCFTDLETNTLFNNLMNQFDSEHPNGNYYNDVLEEEFKNISGNHPLSRKEGDWNNHFPKKDDKHNVIMFASGWGDGYYPAYWGLDSDGNIVELITDFFVLTGQE